MDPARKEELVAQFLEADRRGRRRLLQELTPHLDRDDVVRIAPALRDPSPRTAARIVSLLARHELEDELETQLRGLKPGKVELLRGQYRRLAAREG